MPTPSERRALIFVATLAALGLGARAVRAHLNERADGGGRAPGAGRADAVASAALDRQIDAVDSATADKRSRSNAGSKSKKQRVASGTDERPSPRPIPPPPPPAPADPLALYESRRLEVAAKNRAVQARIDADRVVPPAAGPVKAPRTEATPAPDRRVDVDTADPAALASLPWVGAALAARIVSDRAIRGPFGSLAALQRVRGVGPGLAARIAPFVTFSRPDSRPPEVIRFRPVPLRPRRP